METNKHCYTYKNRYIKFFLRLHQLNQTSTINIDAWSLVFRSLGPRPISIHWLDCLGYNKTDYINFQKSLVHFVKSKHSRVLP